MLGARTREGVSGFIQETMCPVVMVCASEGSVEACSRRGVATAELFKPFARLNDINGACPAPARAAARARAEDPCARTPRR